MGYNIKHGGTLISNFRKRKEESRGVARIFLKGSSNSSKTSATMVGRGIKFRVVEQLKP